MAWYIDFCHMVLQLRPKQIRPPDKKYGKDKLSSDYLLQDWGITYDELEPYYDKFEKMAGISGEDTNPFWGKRSSDFPTPPMKKTPLLKKFEKATSDLGYHPYMIP